MIRAYRRMCCWIMGHDWTRWSHRKLLPPSKTRRCKRCGEHEEGTK